MPLHVLHLGPIPPPEGGITRNIAGIRDELHVRGHRSSVIATTRSSDVSDWEGIYHPTSALSLISTLRRVESDVLHLHIGGEITSRVLMMAVACTVFGKGKPVLTIHSGGYPASPAGRSASRWSLAGWVFRRFARVVAVNEEVEEMLLRFGVAGERVSVIPPYALQLPDESVEITGRIKEFCAAHFPLLVSIGGLERDYEPHLLIDAFGGIRGEFSNAGLMIIGGGSMRSEVEAAVAASSRPDCIFLAGPLDHSIVLRLIKAADAFLRVTLFDGDAISVREALFAGTPVVATDNGMRPKGVVLVPKGDRDAIVTAVRTVIDDSPARTAGVEADNSNIRRVVDLYEDLAE